MGTNAVITAVSAPRILTDWLNESGISPSEIWQDKLLEQKRIWDITHLETVQLYENIKRLQEFLTMHQEFLEEIGKREDFIKWHHDKQL